MKRTFLFFSLCLTVTGWAQNNENKVYYSHTSENGVQFYSTLTPEQQATANQPQQSVQAVVKTIEEFDVTEIENYLSYCESKLEIAKANNKEDDVKRYTELRNRCMARLEELSK